MLDTIKSNEAISRIFSKGSRLSNRYLTLIYIDDSQTSDSASQHDHKGRVAFIAGKKNGGAVWRNSAKRRLRELFRLGKEVPSNFKILLVAKSNILQAPFDEVLEKYNETLRKIEKNS